MMRHHRAFFDLTGRTALVTGGSSGIGEAMAHALGKAGATIILMARRVDALTVSADRLRELGIPAHTLSCDLSDINAIERGAKAAMSISPIHILVNAASVNLRERFEQVTAEIWQTRINLHLSAPFFLTQALVPQMKANGGGAS